MNMAFATSLYPATGKRPIFKIIKPFTRNAATRRNFTVRRNFSCSATVATDITARVSEFDIENQKNDLLRLVQDTQRGLVTTPDQRSCIEEALVSLEGYTKGFPFFQVGQIFQKFECRDQSDGGVIRNVVKWSIPTLLEEQEGATLLVSAKFNVVSARNIYLQFEEISIQNIRISEELQALVAPALLPRSFLSLQILQFIRTFKAQIPAISGRPILPLLPGSQYAFGACCRRWWSFCLYQSSAF
ncbi:PLASTID-LIPID-ASSOCIATED PROTEIN 10 CHLOROPLASTIC-RELATED [Salix purpurea]|uniref:PLASTID-LIPID-ASSOCIATED PROTEIN 10 CHLOROPLASTIC-RELATED n=2 Tax=Salix purpurea TaxID=77065 RepID=A0A9Q0PDP0_SALPP|nr:PLASTID-LIPID-ASSOCIATED PROTEIN 10 CHLOROPLASTIC-RELATED [Salix purpurea]